MTDTIPFVQANAYTKTYVGRTIYWLVLHDMEAPEGPRTAENCAQFFAQKTTKTSAHECIDTDSVVQCVKEQDIAYAAPGANTHGYHFEMCGYARQSRAEWMDEASTATMTNCAKRVAQKCHDLNITPRYCTADMLKKGVYGITTHLQCSVAFKPGGHSDPGIYFPIDWFMQRVIEFYNVGILKPPVQGDGFLSELTADEQRQLFDRTMEMYQAVVGTYAPNMGKDNPRANSISTRLGYLFGESIGNDEQLKEYRALLDNAIKDSTNLEDLKTKMETIETALTQLVEAQGHA